LEQHIFIEGCHNFSVVVEWLHLMKKVTESFHFRGRARVNFLHLKYFLMVAQELNITRAAERLYISQQSLSNHISNMERELDVKLFTRSPKLALTYAGNLLVDTATQILDLNSQYLSKVGDINHHYLGVLRVGVSHTCGLALLPEVLPKFRAQFPMVEFSLFEGNSNQLEDELSHGRVDVIICFQPIIMDGVETVALTEQKLMMLVPRAFTNQLFGDAAQQMRAQFAQGADISAFEGLPFVLIKKGNRTRNIVDQYFSRYLFKPKLILETENTVTTLAMAQAGVGITICPELFLRAIPASTTGEGIDLFPLSDPSTFSKLVAGYRQDRYLSHFATRFIALAQQALANSC
jgi:DNA-binding transcriptional LysR family regulator